LARLDAAGKLVGRRAISEEEYRLAQVNVQVNRFMALKEAEKRVVEQKKAERARVFLQDHEIRSPIRGIIKKCFKREKESVTSNDLQLFHIVASDKVWVEGMAPVNALYRVRVGQKVDVKLVIPEPERSIGEPRKGISSGVPSAKSPVDGDRSPESRVELPQEKLTFQGTIVYIDPNADPSGGVFRVRAEVDNQFDPETGDPVLRAGLNTNMKIYLNAQAERN
jgi:multidrug resistance efflux pump